NVSSSRPPLSRRRGALVLLGIAAAAVGFAVLGRAPSKRDDTTIPATVSPATPTVTASVPPDAPSAPLPEAASATSSPSASPPASASASNAPSADLPKRRGSAGGHVPKDPLSTQK